MLPTQSLQSFSDIHILSDPRRLAILRRLMQQRATLTQLAAMLDSYPAKVRHHLKKLEAAGLVVLVATEIVGGVVEKYYQATSQAYLVNLAVLPMQAAGGVVVMGSDDPALAQVAAAASPAALALSVGSLDGLIALRQGMCQIAGAHLLGSDNEYNQSYVRHLFPGQAMLLLTLSNREQGLMVAPGNPKGIMALTDLGRPDVVFVNRQPGAGTRVWLERQLQVAGVAETAVSGFDHMVTTHQAVATAVASGQADVGLGVLAAAQSAGLDFVPLFAERYDLIVPRQVALEDAAVRPLLDYLQSKACRQTIGTYAGYSSDHTGETHEVAV